MEKQKPEKFWLTARIEIDPIMEEAVSDYLVGVIGASVEQAADGTEPTLILNAFFEEENPDIQAQQELKNALHKHLKDLATLFDVATAVISWDRIEDQDWSSNWKVHFKPFAITKDLVIAPTWEEYHQSEDEHVIVMDPGMAFGTGHHATTSLSLDFIRECLQTGEGQNVLDVGTGTGILGLGAALFGASQVLGIDNDPEAVRAASENVLLNRLDTIMEVSQKPLQEIGGGFDLIVANIIHDVLVTMVDTLATLLRADGDLILSGILQGTQEENIIAVFGGCGFTFVERKQKEEWVALHFTKTP